MGLVQRMKYSGLIRRYKRTWYTLSVNYIAPAVLYRKLRSEFNPPRVDRTFEWPRAWLRKLTISDQYFDATRPKINCSVLNSNPKR